jgi:hypothetical protein
LRQAPQTTQPAAAMMAPAAVLVQPLRQPAQWAQWASVRASLR